MTFTLRVVVTALLGLTFWSWGAGIAAAHTALVGSDPANDARVSSPPGAVALTFSEDINPAFATVVVHSADGRNWVSGQARVDGPRLTADMGPERLPNGKYTVGYRVVSADGHPVSGSYSFTVVGAPDQPSSATTSATAAPSTSATPAPSTASSGPDTKTSLLTAAVAGLAVGGVIAFWQSRKRRRSNGGNPDSGRNSSGS